MTALLLDADGLLRGGTDSAAAPPLRARQLLTLVIVFGLAYGAVMGTFAGVAGQRALQVVYSAVKVPILLMVTFGLSLPSFFVLNTLLGVRADFGRALYALLATQAVLTIVLASLAPLTAFWYVSSDHYQLAILFNALMFAVASVAAQRYLRRRYRDLIAANPVHTALLRVWLILYALVGIQMGWVLRPFVGRPGAPTRFFREEVWDNAYVVVANMVWRVLRETGGWQ